MECRDLGKDEITSHRLDVHPKLYIYMVSGNQIKSNQIKSFGSPPPPNASSPLATATALLNAPQGQPTGGKHDVLLVALKCKSRRHGMLQVLDGRTDGRRGVSE